MKTIKETKAWIKEEKENADLAYNEILTNLFDSEITDAEQVVQVKEASRQQSALFFMEELLNFIND